MRWRAGKGVGFLGMDDGEVGFEVVDGEGRNQVLRTAWAMYTQEK